jgi:hypothetical protein
MRNHITPLQAIRKKCLDCSVFSPKEVRLCPSTDCSIYPFRFGSNPHLKGKGQAQNLTSSKGLPNA